MTRAVSSPAPRLFLIGVVIPLLLAAAITATGSNRTLFVVLYHAVHVVPASMYAFFWESATYAGDGLAAVVLATLFLRWRVDVALAAFVATIPVVGAFTHGIRAFISVDRPPLVLSNLDLAVLGPVLQHGSFPSGHSATGAALAGVAVLAIRSTGWRIVFVMLACVIGLSRIAVGVHWPVDVCVGFAGGWLSAWIAWQLVVDRAWTRARTAQIVTCVLFAGAAAWLFVHPMGLPEATPFRVGLAIVGLVASSAALWPKEGSDAAPVSGQDAHSRSSPSDPDLSRTMR